MQPQRETLSFEIIFLRPGVTSVIQEEIHPQLMTKTRRDPSKEDHKSSTFEIWLLHNKSSGSWGGDENRLIWIFFSYLSLGGVFSVKINPLITDVIHQ